MEVFVDTSALYAVLDADDAHHGKAAATWSALLDDLTDGTARCVTHSGVIVEASALVQRRLGMRALRALHDRLLRIVDVTWVDADLHGRALSALLAAGSRDVSLVDWTSFELMRERAIEVAFAFDDDFDAQGFAGWSPRT